MIKVGLGSTERQTMASAFNLKKSVGRRKDIQDIDVNSELKNYVVILRVMSKFFNLLSTPSMYAFHV